MARKTNRGNLGRDILLVIALLIGIAVWLGTIALVFGVIIGAVYLIHKHRFAYSDTTSSEYGETSAVFQIEAREVSTSKSAEAYSKSANDENVAKVRQLIRQYQIKAVDYPPRINDPLQQELASFQCNEVIQAKNRLLAQREAYVKKMNTIKSEVDNILAYPQRAETEDKLLFLENAKPQLQDKIAEYQKLSQQMQNQKITLMDKHSAAFVNLQDAINKVCQSQKIINLSGLSLNSFIKMNATLPDNTFYSPTKPIKLNFGAYHFYLLPEVILVYNKQNEFVTAYEPMALVIKCKEIERKVSMSKSGYRSDWHFRDTLVAADSFRVSEGKTTTSWQHERKGGGPDMRYSNNPMYQCRTDTFRCGEISFRIGQYKADYAFSAGNISQKVTSLIRDYTSIMHRQNTAHSLLHLLESAARKNDQAHKLCVHYEGTNKDVFVSCN